MKKTALLGIALCLMAGAQAQWGKKVRGNGNMERMERSTGDYDAVAVSGFFDVELVSGNEGDVMVHAEENLQEYIITEVERGTLVIKVKKGVNIRPSSGNGHILIVVPVEDIESVALSGSGDIVGKTILKSSAFKSSMSGSGNVQLEVECDEISASMSGSGNMNLKGDTGRFHVQISGSGDVEAFELNAREVDANISGSADIRVTANEILRARVSGSGDIQYRGNPTKIDSKSSGSGSISKG